MEGRQLVMVLAPKLKQVQAKPAKPKAAAEGSAAKPPPRPKAPPKPPAETATADGEAKK